MGEEDIMVKAIIFDYGKVMSHYSRLGIMLGIMKHVPFWKYPATFVFFRKNWARLNGGSVGAEGFHARLRKECGFRLDYKDTVKEYLTAFSHIGGTTGIIKRLKARGYRLQIMSNCNEVDHEFLIKKHPAIGLFDAVTVSYRLKKMKPEKGIYLDAIKKSKGAAEDCLFIDDSRKNIGAAVALGMKGIVFRNPAQLERKLKGMGVL